nr:hypothetical protein JLTIEETK_JLTIEETK_CDS_0006 [Microvirus sp.]
MNISDLFADICVIRPRQAYTLSLFICCTTYKIIWFNFLSVVSL